MKNCKCQHAELIQNDESFWDNDTVNNEKCVNLSKIEYQKEFV